MFSANSGQERMIGLASGLALHCLDLPGRSPPLIFLHGLADSRHSFDLLLLRLRPEQRCLLPDLRGHGRSAKPLHGYSPEDMAQDIIELGEALGLDSFSLIGHSLGSLAALRLAALRPDKVKKVALISAAAHAGRSPVIQALAKHIEGLG